MLLNKDNGYFLELNTLYRESPWHDDVYLKQSPCWKATKLSTWNWKVLDHRSDLSRSKNGWHILTAPAKLWCFHMFSINISTTFESHGDIMGYHYMRCYATPPIDLSFMAVAQMVFEKSKGVLKGWWHREMVGNGSKRRLVLQHGRMSLLATWRKEEGSLRLKEPEVTTSPFLLTLIHPELRSKLRQ